MLNESEAQAIADKVLSVTLGPSGFDRSAVEIRQDHAGEESLFVTAHFKPGLEVLSGDSAVRAISTLREAFEGEGERRFPYLAFDYPDEDAPFEEEEVPVEA